MSNHMSLPYVSKPTLPAPRHPTQIPLTILFLPQSQFPVTHFQNEDWVVLSSKLKLKKVRIEDSGKYTCTAQHPSISRLSKTRTISITVLPGERRQCLNTRLDLTQNKMGLGRMGRIQSHTAALGFMTTTALNKL